MQLDSITLANTDPLRMIKRLFQKDLEYTLLFITEPHVYEIPSHHSGSGGRPSDNWMGGFLNKSVPSVIKNAIQDIALHHKHGMTDDFLIRDAWIQLRNWINECHGRTEVRMIKAERRAKSPLTPATRRLSAEAAKFEKGCIKVALPYLRADLRANYNRQPRSYYYIHIPTFFKMIRDKTDQMINDPQSSDPVLDHTYDVVREAILRHGIFSMELISDIAENLMEI